MIKTWFSREDKTAGQDAETQAGVSSSLPSPASLADEASHTMVVGGGCFWCTEAVFLAVRGVRSVESGYSGGSLSHPDYDAICTGTSGHAEVVRVHFDPAQVDLKTLYQIFFATHDPTTLNRQGHDVGTQYRSVILTLSEQQERIAKALVSELEASKIFASAIVTQIVPLERFWIAEAYHQNYFARNPFQGYCIGVVAPKVAKFRKQFAGYLK